MDNNFVSGCHGKKKFKWSEILLPSSNSLQSFKQIKQKTLEILHFHFFSIAFVMSYLSENEAENLKSLI